MKVLLIDVGTEICFIRNTNLVVTWWQVDLGNQKNIKKIVIYNRTDCCADRLSNYQVMATARNLVSLFSVFLMFFIFKNND
jgi:hypothetical protein